MIKETEIRNYFNKACYERIELISRQDAIGFNYRDKTKWFVNRLRGIQGSLLDIGCNIGNMEFFIREQGISTDILQLTGIDIAEKSIEVAKNRNIPGANFQVCSALSIDFPDNIFDVITCMEVIEHIPDQSGAMREIARLLKPGGMLLLSTPNAECKTWLFDECVRSLYLRLLGKKTVEKDNPLTLAQLKSLLLDSNLIPVEGPRYYWYRPYQNLKGYLWWPPHLAIKGLLATMKHFKKIEESGRLGDEERRKYSMSIVAVARKKP